MSVAANLVVGSNKWYLAIKLSASRKLIIFFFLKKKLLIPLYCGNKPNFVMNKNKNARKLLTTKIYAFHYTTRIYTTPAAAIR